MEAAIQAIGVAAPGLPDWDRARPVLAGRARYQPAPAARPRSALLPRAEARRATALIHLSLSAAEQVLPDPSAAADPELAAVFATADGDLGVLDRTCRSLADETAWISPHSFHNSVHNAPSGYWSIATGCQGPSTTVCAGKDSFAAGLLEALLLLGEPGRERCLLVAYDEASPPALADVRAVPEGFACALLLGRSGTGRELRVRNAAPGVPSCCLDLGLESLRCSNPAAQALPLLVALAGGDAASLRLGGGGNSLQLDLARAE